MNKKAEAGIGTLILFIALILVVAIAAGVLISTTGHLQSKALVTGSRAQAQVSSQMSVLLVWGENASVSDTINDLYMKVKLAPGSNPIILNATSIDVVVNGSTQQSYTYNAASCTATNVANPTYAANFLVNGQIGYNTPGYLMQDDVVDLCLRLPSTLYSDQSLKISIVPTAGLTTEIRTISPEVMTTGKVQLFP